MLGLELGLERVEDLGQVNDVVESVLELVARERTARPVGVAVGFGQVHVADGPDERTVAHLQRKAQKRCRCLRVEHGSRHDARLVVQNADVLRARVEYLHAVLIRQDRNERGEVFHGNRVDERSDGAVVDLEQAQTRVIGLLAQEFGVDAEDLGALEPGGERGQLLDVRDVFAHMLVLAVLLAGNGWSCGGLF